MKKAILFFTLILVSLAGYTQDVNTIKGKIWLKPPSGFGQDTIQSYTIINKNLSGNAGFTAISGNDTLILQLDSNGVFHIKEATRLRIFDSLLIANFDTVYKEILNEGDFTTSTKWITTGNFSISGGTATFSGTSGTLKQKENKLALTGLGNNKYRFIYTVSNMTGVGCTAFINTDFASSNTNLVLVNGTDTLTFISANDPTDFKIECTCTSGGFDLDDFSLKVKSDSIVFIKNDLYTNGVFAKGSSAFSGDVQILGSLQGGSPLIISTPIGEIEIDGDIHLIKDDETWTIGIDTADVDQFKISNDDTLGISDRLVIDTFGNIGIGTSSPGSKLHIVESVTSAETGQTIDYSINNATANGEGLFVAAKQLTTPRTAGVVIAMRTQTTSLAGDLNFASYYNFFAESPINGGGTVFHTALGIGAGFDEVIDMTELASGEGIFGMGDNLAIAARWEDMSANDYLTFITTTGSETVNFGVNVGIGTTTPDRALEISGTSNNTASMRISSFGGGFSSRLEILRANGTEGTPSAVFAGNQLGQIAHMGYDGTSFADAVLIHGVANQNWAVGSHGSRLEFQTILDGTTSPATRMTIADDGNVGIGASTVDEKTHIAKAVDGAAIGLLIENSQANSVGSINETVEIRFGFGGNNDVGRIVAEKLNDYTIANNEDATLNFSVDINGVITEIAQFRGGGLRFTSGARKIEFDGALGGGGQGITYEDLGGDLRNSLMFPGSDLVVLSNQASNGTVEIRSNTVTAGSGGEVTVATFEDDEISLLVSGGNVGIGTSTPNAESLLELESTTKALRLTRMTTAQRTAMTGVSGLIVYDTTLEFIFYHTGSAWVQL